MDMGVFMCLCKWVNYEKELYMFNGKEVNVGLLSYKKQSLCDPAILLRGIYLKEMKLGSQRNTCPPVLIVLCLLHSYLKMR